MARTKTAQLFEKNIRFALQDVFPPEFQKRHAEFARQVKQAYLKQHSVPPAVETFVDGRNGADENSVKPYGLIRYEFFHLAGMGQMMLETARAESPTASGKYRDSWFLMVDGKRTNEIPADAKEIVLTNDQPYHRKLEVTTNVKKLKLNRPPGIVQIVEQKLLREFGDNISVAVAFIDLPDAYILITDRPRRDRRKGMRITYPAVIVSL